MVTTEKYNMFADRVIPAFIKNLDTNKQKASKPLETKTRRQTSALSTPLTPLTPEDVSPQDLLCKAVASWFVRKENRFYDIQRWNASINANDLQRTCIHRFRNQFPDVTITNELLRDVFSKAIEAKHNDPTQSIPVWNGARHCQPSHPDSVVWADGMVSLNSWSVPPYRKKEVTEGDLGLFEALLNKAIPRAEDQKMFTHWLAWCLQNEDDKPTWAPFLYSRTKGTGKSTLCQLVSRLFGTKNSITLNSVSSLTAKFNLPILLSKLVICEELQLRPDSPQGNQLKTYMTEKETAAEAKGRDIERVSQCCCFIFTSNHLPVWIESDERRYYVIDMEHSGHASGKDAKEFGSFIGEVVAYMDDEESLARLYRALMSLKLPNSFNAKSLNVAELDSPIMKQIQGTSRQVILEQLEELLAERGAFAISQADLVQLCIDRLKCNPNQIRHLMTELRWSRSNVKWGGVDYARSIWVHPDYQVSGGQVKGPGGYEEAVVTDHEDIEFQEREPASLPEIGRVSE